MFLDIFVAFSFCSNLYIWRNFNIFLGLKLIGTLLISIIIDIVWESFKLYHYSDKHASAFKKMRVASLVLTIVNVVIKVILMILYYKLSNEN